MWSSQYLAWKRLSHMTRQSHPTMPFFQICQKTVILKLKYLKFPKSSEQNKNIFLKAKHSTTNNFNKISGVLYFFYAATRPTWRKSQHTVKIPHKKYTAITFLFFYNFSTYLKNVFYVFFFTFLGYFHIFCNFFLFFTYFYVFFIYFMYFLMFFLNFFITSPSIHQVRSTWFFVLLSNFFLFFPLFFLFFPYFFPILILFFFHVFFMCFFF